MFPISDSIKTKGFPLFTVAIIACTIFVFFKEIFSPDIDSFIHQYALIPSLVHVNDPSTWFPFISSIFLHGGFLHIITNMWFFWIFGDDVEEYIGKFSFLLLYLFSGIIGNIV